MLTAHIVFWMLGYYVVNAAVGAMPKPRAEQVNGFYGWMFGFLQTLCANADRLAEARFGPRVAPEPIPFIASAPAPPRTITE